MTISLQAMEAELTASLTRGGTGRAAADALCTTCVGLVGVDGAAVSVILDGVSWGTFGSSSEASRRLNEYQFTFGEGPSLDAMMSRTPVLVPDLESPHEPRWPLLSGALLEVGIRGVFAVPIMVTSVCVGALDLFRTRSGPLEGDCLAGATLAAELAAVPLLDLLAEADSADHLEEETRSGTDETMADLDRVEVYQATGMLIAALDVGAEEALVRLRAHAIGTGQTASEVARAIVERRFMLERDHRDGLGGQRGATGEEGDS